MDQSPWQIEVDGARAFEALFVPALFREWAPRVAAAARIQPGDAVLDVGCGTGILARTVVGLTGAGSRVVGLDPNAGMLAVAREIAPDIEWQQGTAESLPFPDGTFDAVVSQFALMFFADRRQGLREMLRVLAHGGRLAVAVWDSLEHTAAYAIEADVVERIAGKAAADMLRAPFLLGDPRTLAGLFDGLASVDVAAHPGTARFPSVRVMVEADLRGWLPVVGVVLSEEHIRQILDEAEEALRPYVAPDGRVAFESPALIASWTKP